MRPNVLRVINDPHLTGRYVYTPVAIPKTELSTTERTNLRFRRAGPVMAPPIRHASDDNEANSLLQAGSEWASLTCAKRRSFVCCMHRWSWPATNAVMSTARTFAIPIQTASGGKRSRTPRMRCGCSGYESGRPTCPQGFSFHLRCGGVSEFQHVRLKSPDCGRRRFLSRYSNCQGRLLPEQDEELTSTLRLTATQRLLSSLGRPLFGDDTLTYRDVLFPQRG